MLFSYSQGDLTDRVPDPFTSVPEATEMGSMPNLSGPAKRVSTEFGPST